MSKKSSMALRCVGKLCTLFRSFHGTEEINSCHLGPFTTFRGGFKELFLLFVAVPLNLKFQEVNVIFHLPAIDPDPSWGRPPHKRDDVNSLILRDVE